MRGKIGRKEAKARGIVSLPEAKAWKDVAMGKLDQRKVSPRTNPFQREERGGGGKREEEESKADLFSFPFRVSRRSLSQKLLETYLHSILEATLPEKDDFCWFLSTGVVPNEIAAQQIITKEGMLLKRGQKFGGWKKRFFTLGGLGRPVMDYFDGVSSGPFSSFNVGWRERKRSKLTPFSRSFVFAEGRNAHRIDPSRWSSDWEE